MRVGSTRAGGWVGEGEGPRSLKYSRAQGRAIPREIKATNKDGSTSNDPSSQASCAVDTVDSSGWTALHHAGGYSPASPTTCIAPEAELGDCSTWGSGDVPGTYSPSSSRSLMHYRFLYFLWLYSSSLHHPSLKCTLLQL